jgi:hypothetical protein
MLYLDGWLFRSRFCIIHQVAGVLISHWSFWPKPCDGRNPLFLTHIDVEVWRAQFSTSCSAGQGPDELALARLRIWAKSQRHPADQGRVHPIPLILYIITYYHILSKIIKVSPYMAHPEIQHIKKHNRNQEFWGVIYIHLSMYEGDELSKGKPLTLIYIFSMWWSTKYDSARSRSWYLKGLTGTICGVLGRRGLPGNQFFWGSGGT